VLLHQPADNPRSLDLSLATTPDASCDSPGDLQTKLRIPLDRAAQPVLGQSQAPRLFHGGKDLGNEGAFHFKMDSLEMKIGSTAAGIAYISHTRQRDPRIIFSGRFSATYCGVSK